MESSDFFDEDAVQEEVAGWSAASSNVIATVLNHAIVAEDLSGFAALLSDIARDRGLKGAGGGFHQSIFDMPYASLLPRQQHLLADAFELFIKLGLEFKPREPIVND
jgi:hypothetical protein